MKRLMTFLFAASAGAATIIAPAKADFDCIPGRFLCLPDEAVVRRVLAERYPEIDIQTIKFSRSSPKQSRDDPTQWWFRVEFAGTAVFKEDFLSDLHSSELLAACPMPGGAIPLDGFRLYERRAKTGETINFSGDAAVKNVDGQWGSTANLMRYRRLDGTELFGNAASIFGGNPAIAGEPSGDEACEEMKKRVAGKG